jgi:serine protease Do
VIDMMRQVSPRRLRRAVLSAGMAMLLALSMGAVLVQGKAAATAPENAAVANAADLGKAFAAVTKRVEPAVVFIEAVKREASTTAGTIGGLSGPAPDDLLRQFFGGRHSAGPVRPVSEEGAGFLIAPDGYILTNNHIVNGADKLSVTLRGGRKVEAKLVGTDERTDVAVIKIDGQGLPVLPMGDSDAIDVGEWVLAIGSPFGLAGTVTSGIVSAKGRDGMGITDFENFIQTDAAMNPGNSGGPLVDLRGEAVGISTAIVTRSGGYNGIGFAIPMNLARQVSEELIKHGSIARGYLGVTVQTLTPELARLFQIPDTLGVLVGDVTADSPAAAAGLQRGDVIVGANGEPIKNNAAFRNQLALTKPDSSMTLEVVRQAKHQEITVQVGKLPEKPPAVVAAATPPVAAPASSWGITVRGMSDQLAQQLGVSMSTGVIVTEVDPAAIAATAGIMPGMIIVEVNRKPIHSAEEFDGAIADAKDADSLLLLVQVGDRALYTVLDKSH